MRVVVGFIALALLTLAACSNGDDRPAAPTAPVPSASVAAPASTPGRSPSPAAVASPVPASTPRVTIERVAAGFTRPVFVTNAGDGSGRLFVVEKGGLIRVVQGGRVDPEPYLDLRSVVTSDGNEQGLLGLAFHPGFAQDGRLFVTYTAARDGANTLAEYRVPRPGARPDPATARILLAVPDRFPNHNGGIITFGPDGYLYLGTGDGGSQGDPNGNGQNRFALLGKLLRLDVDHTQGELPYAIPADNPYRAEGGAPQAWAIGLRNPWRFSFDRQTGDLWIADVGQNAWEEVDFVPAGSKGGLNFGWNVMEGTRCYRPASGCDRSGLQLPVFELGHDDGNCSVTGGYVYRGKASPALAGTYLFSDYCGGTLLGLRKGADGTWQPMTLAKTGGTVTSFGEDEAGEVYFVEDNSGGLFHVTATAG